MTIASAQRILVAGDWHGHTAWARQVIARVPELLAGEPSRLVLQLGDFGVWPGPAGADYLDQVSLALDKANARLWFIDGNHDWHTRLAELREEARRRNAPGWPLVAVDARGLIWHLPRGHRWRWHGREWLAVGGAVSLDRAVRIEGESWWPEEEITDGQERDVILRGLAEVMITHECPAGVVHTFPTPPPFWDLADLARSDAHRERLQRIVDAVQPEHLLHGHLHLAYQRVCDFGYGPVQVTGLDKDDGWSWNYAVLNTELMAWEPRSG